MCSPGPRRWRSASLENGQNAQPAGDGKGQGSIFIGTGCSAYGYLKPIFLESPIPVGQN
jgi:hypothetical protein